MPGAGMILRRFMIKRTRVANALFEIAGWAVY
jgi:hypothetical protein